MATKRTLENFKQIGRSIRASLDEFIELPRLRRVERKTVLAFCCLVFLSLFSILLSTTWWSINQSSDEFGEGMPGTAFGWRPGQSQSKNKQFRIVLCSKATSENPYLLEWIEFHRLQGVDKFVLYHDAIPSDPKTVATALQLEWLVTFYRDAERLRRRAEEEGRTFLNQSSQWKEGIEDVVEVQSASLLVYDSWAALRDLHHNTDLSHHMLQNAIVNDCVERYKDKAEYVMHIDHDEFVYSPDYETVWDFLRTRKIQGRWSSGVFETVVGFYLPSVNFGSSGVLWDFHNFWAPDLSSGTVSAYFDPRDSSLFHALQQFNRSSNLSPVDFAVQLDEFRVSRLKDQSLFPTHDVNMFSEHVYQRHLHDFPSDVSVAPFLDVLSIPTFQAGETKDSPLKGLSDHINTVVSQIQISQKEFKYQDQHHPFPSVLNTSDLPERVKLYQYYVKNSAFFYPSVIEEQVRRGPSVWSGIDSKETASRVAKDLFPACQISEPLREQFLIDQEGFQFDSLVLSKTLQLYSNLCQGELPGWITQIGKVIYNTSSIRRNQTTRSSGRLRGCYRPSIHGCAHKIYGGYLEWADGLHDLRVDHHQFRSYQKRSFDLPKWRGGPLGYPSLLNFTILQEFLGSVVDTGKLRFVPKLRERLAQLQVLPKMPDYVWSTKIEDDEVVEISIDRRNAIKKCSALELLGERQIMCPSDYPHVGYYAAPVVPPSPYLPYNWCSDSPMDETANPWERPFDLLQLYPDESNSTDVQILRNHTVLCPGFGETRCCDYDSALQVYQSSRFPGHELVTLFEYS